MKEAPAAFSRARFLQVSLVGSKKKKQTKGREGGRCAVIGWTPGGLYLYLREGVPLVLVRASVGCSVVQLPREEVEVGQERWEVNQRLEQDSKHGVYSVVERGESLRVAPRWATRATSRSGAVSLAQGRGENRRKSNWKWKVEEEWGSGVTERSLDFWTVSTITLESSRTVLLPGHVERTDWALVSPEQQKWSGFKGINGVLHRLGIMATYFQTSTLIRLEAS